MRKNINENEEKKMTQEERANKWFSNIEGAEEISMDTRLKICSRVAGRLAFLVIGVVLIELALVFMLGGGAYFTGAADFLNNFAGNIKGRNRNLLLAAAGLAAVLPFMLLPIVLSLVLRSKWLKAELARAKRN